tara:strand:- start:3 stop:191 length:189 start_codon:yes stop_codon:yes gene_type:complete
MLKVGDLVFWTGFDEHNGCIGVISKVYRIQHLRYEVVWSDGTIGRDLYGAEIKAVEDANTDV